MERPRSLTLVPHNQARIGGAAQPSVDVLPTPDEWVMYPQAGLLTGLLSLLATEPEPDKLPAYLMRELAEQLGADGAYLFRTDAATQTLALAPWAIVDGAIRQYDSLPALEPLMSASAFEPLAAPQTKRYMLRDDEYPERNGRHRRISLLAERYTLRHDQHPYLGPARIARFRQQGYRVGLTLPLLAGTQTLGFLECMARDDTAFLPAQIDLARALAEQLSLALQCAQMIEHAARAAAFEERQRLAREIHDTVGQAFTAILVQLRSADETLVDAPDLARTAIGQVRELARDGLADTRRTVDTLRPQPLDRFDLASALRRAAVQATLGTPMDVQCNVLGDVYALPIDTALQLLRIAQEALCNALKYADAQRLTIELVFEPEQAQLCVRDDGRGFDLTQATAAGGFGLLSMRARAAAIGAELIISSAPGQGTSLVVALPRNTGERDEC
ncbi:MAG TPA: sensor histidine kinase [Roseiflexaceae bacterium]|nr:sensor histidine kinase [Roseiflexaceae bacterium]